MVRFLLNLALLELIGSQLVLMAKRKKKKRKSTKRRKRGGRISNI